MTGDLPFALFITWTCYGTWLPGDRRGYVSNTRRGDGTYERKHNMPGTPYTADDVLTRQQAALAKRHATAVLDSASAPVAAAALVEACEKRDWYLLRGALMWNHVHVVVRSCPDDGPDVRRVLKGVSQNALCKSGGASRRWWTAGGSDRYLHGDRAIEAAIHYVANQYGRLAEIIDMRIIDSERRGSSPP